MYGFCRLENYSQPIFTITNKNDNEDTERKRKWYTRRFTPGKKTRLLITVRGIILLHSRSINIQINKSIRNQAINKAQAETRERKRENVCMSSTVRAITITFCPALESASGHGPHDRCPCPSDGHCDKAIGVIPAMIECKGGSRADARPGYCSPDTWSIRRHVLYGPPLCLPFDGGWLGKIFLLFRFDHFGSFVSPVFFSR